MNNKNIDYVINNNHLVDQCIQISTDISKEIDNFIQTNDKQKFDLEMFIMVYFYQHKISNQDEILNVMRIIENHKQTFIDMNHEKITILIHKMEEIENKQIDS